MRENRKGDRIIIIPPCADRARRQQLEADDVAWLRHYFGPDSGMRDPFTYIFTDQQLEMIDAIRHAISTGGDQAIAASRGEGKTTLAERILTKYTLQGVLAYSVLFASTGAMADNSLDTIKVSLEENELLLVDYPEVCVPIIALEHIPNRAHYQIASGVRFDNGEPFEAASTKFTWCGQEAIMPNVPGSPAAGAIIATRGLDSAVRGLKKRGKRPQLAVIDDPDTEETATSETQAKKLEQRIDRAIGGLGGQRRGIARVMLTTLQSRVSTSYRFTDPLQKPTWRGKRFRFLVAPPERTDLWEEYIALRAADFVASTEAATEFYASRREAMDAGAAVANPNRFDPESELSALQHYHNQVARIGREAVATELDNDPPEESGPIESGITPHRIQRQVSGYARGVVPPDCRFLSQGVDVGKGALHWVVRAWRDDATGFTIDYGTHEVRGTVQGSDEGVDVSVRRAIVERFEASRNRYLTAGGEIRKVDMTLVDAGWRTDAVYSACAAFGIGVMPVMGFGKSAGCVQANFHDQQRSTADRRPGDGWFRSRKGSLWLVCADADRWKAWEHDRWMTTPGRPGCMQLFGEPGDGKRLSQDEQWHHTYAKHLCNEIEIEEPYKDTMRRRWKAKSDNTHYLDASYYADVAANVLGIRLPTSMKAAAAKAQSAAVQDWYGQQKRMA